MNKRYPSLFLPNYRSTSADSCIPPPTLSLYRDYLYAQPPPLSQRALTEQSSHLVIHLMIQRRRCRDINKIATIQLPRWRPPLVYILLNLILQLHGGTDDDDDDDASQPRHPPCSFTIFLARPFLSPSPFAMQLVRTAVEVVVRGPFLTFTRALLLAEKQNVSHIIGQIRYPTKKAYTTRRLNVVKGISRSVLCE